MGSSDDITKHHKPSADYNPWIGEAPKPAPIDIVDYDERWPAQFALLALRIRTALGDAAIAIEHVGSTSVPGLAAKPTIDIDLSVVNPADETSYVPALERAGFTLTVREPDWHQHRVLSSVEPSTNVHVFGPDCPEVLRHRMFRDWLKAQPDDLELYRRAELMAAAAFADGAGTIMQYNQRKEPVIREIYARMFQAHGLLR